MKRVPHESGAHLSIWQSIEDLGRIGARSVPLRSVSATTSSLGPFHRASACLTAAAWDNPRSACQKPRGATVRGSLKIFLAMTRGPVAIGALLRKSRDSLESDEMQTD